MPLQGTSRVYSDTRDIDLPIGIPGSVYDALICAGLLEDPFYGLNEHQSQWVHETDWTIVTEFTIPPEIRARKHILLKFYGIDTFATILLNDSVLGQVDNMHREYEFEITYWAKEGPNRLAVQFQSPSKVARQSYEADHQRLKPFTGQVPGRLYVHKAQYSFGWDWGPALPDIGIWRPVELIGMDGARLLDVQAVPKFAPDYAKVTLGVQVHGQWEAVMEKQLSYRATLQYESPQAIQFKQMQEGTTPHLAFEFAPQLWWTTEQGKPNLYHLEVQLLAGGKVVDTIATKIGLRDLKLVRRKDEWGESFFFQLNGVPVFMKGADWIPVQSFIPKGRRLNLIRSTLIYATQAHMNMLRIWGGGVMEDDEVYNFCDEHGILLWQDFPFACGFNPIIRNDAGEFNAFYENIGILATQNVIRLRNHPSLAIWVGNNETEEFVPGKGLEVVTAYCDIFERLLPKICSELDPTRPYWPASPSSGGSGGTGVFPPHVENAGDTHFWSVWHGGWDFATYRDNFSRFMSEFGFEAFPDLKTCAEFCPPDQQAFESPIMRNHQKHPDGNAKILNYMRKRFAIPPDFARQVLLSQVNQADAIEYGVEHWRRNRGAPGREHCMGTLYWQLNDCWPVASWSSVDYSKKLAEQHHAPGRWKALHYFACRFYRPVIVSIAEAPDFSEIWAVNDLNYPQLVQLTWQLLDPAGKTWKSGKKECALAACASEKLEAVDVRENFGYRWAQLKGCWKISAGDKLEGEIKAFNHAGLTSSTLPVINPESPMILAVAPLLVDFVDQSVLLKVYAEKEGFRKRQATSIVGFADNLFEGRCVVNDKGQVCIQKQIAPSNPALFDVPFIDLLEPFLDQEDIILEIAATSRAPPLILAAQLAQGGIQVSETYKTFTAPGDLPLEDPHLTWAISRGGDKEWTIDIDADKPALYVHMASDTLDFWADDNFFFMAARHKTVHITLLEAVTKDELANQLQVRSLKDLLK